MSTNHTACSDADQNGPSPSTAPTCQTHSIDAVATLLRDLGSSAIPCVDPVTVPGAEVRVIGSEEGHHRGDVFGLDARLDALLSKDLRLFFRRVPESHLTRRAHGAGNDASDSNPGLADLARQRASHAFDAG